MDVFNIIKEIFCLVYIILFCELKASAKKSFKNELTLIIYSHKIGTDSVSMALYPVNKKLATCKGHSKNKSIIALLISPWKIPTTIS